MRKLFMSDIHGCYWEMMSVLRHANYNPEVDHLVIGGDMIDRGPHSALVLAKVMHLQESYPEKVRVIAGNHEDMMIEFFKNGDPMWLNFSEEATASFQEHFTQKGFNVALEWIRSLPEMTEDDEYVYVHAGINPFRKEQLREEMLWMPYDTF